jgi:hypothetical protein
MKTLSHIEDGAIERSIASFTAGMIHVANVGWLCQLAMNDKYNTKGHG